MKYQTTIMTGEFGDTTWGVVIGDFKTEKEAKKYIKQLKQVGK